MIEYLEGTRENTTRRLTVQAQLLKLGNDATQEMKGPARGVLAMRRHGGTLTIVEMRIMTDMGNGLGNGPLLFRASRTGNQERGCGRQTLHQPFGVMLIFLDNFAFSGKKTNPEDFDYHCCKGGSKSAFVSRYLPRI